MQPSSRSQGMWRAGAHTDFDCLTLLFQRPGQGGLQVCPGKDRESQQWTSIEPREEVITCNIGDMLMRWSDDQLPSNFHRVRNPLPHEYQGPRYSLAFFCQANKDVEILGPQRKYPPISAEDYLQQRIQANFAKGKMLPCVVYLPPAFAGRAAGYPPLSFSGGRACRCG